MKSNLILTTLIILFIFNGCTNEEDELRIVLEKSCATKKIKDDYKACNSLGNMYDKGRGGVEENFDIAKHYYTEACNGGLSYSCFNVGYMYSLDKRGKQDLFKAVNFYTRACDGNDFTGCFTLGVLYEKGQGIKENRLKAKELYQKACNGGIKSGCREFNRLN
jgi:TPR repeat protein